MIGKLRLLKIVDLEESENDISLEKFGRKNGKLKKAVDSSSCLLLSVELLHNTISSIIQTKYTYDYLNL